VEDNWVCDCSRRRDRVFSGESAEGPGGARRAGRAAALFGEIAMASEDYAQLVLDHTGRVVWPLQRGVEGCCWSSRDLSPQRVSETGRECPDRASLLLQARVLPTSPSTRLSPRRALEISHLL